MDKNLSGPGHVHIGRETIYCNGSLLLENVNQKDTENYTLQTYNRHGKIVSTTSMYLHVSAFLWKCGRLGTSTKITIESVPPRVTEGRNALLLVHNLPENIESFFWFKGVIGVKNLLVIRHIPDRKSTKWGPAYTGRETLYSDGSLLLRGVTQKDHGLYFLQILRRDDELEEAEVQLQVDTPLSLFCNPLTSSQLMIQVVPRYPAEGESILLQVHNLPEDLLNFIWYKSKYGTLIPKTVEYNRARNSTIWWPAHRGRGMVYNNGSLMLQNVTEKDAGMYTLEVSKNDSKIEKASVELYVKKNVTQPFVRITDTTVAGRRSVVFSCISPDTDIFIHWFFNNKSLKLTERMTMSPTKCGLKIDPIKSEDAGEYKCELSFLCSVTLSYLPNSRSNQCLSILLKRNMFFSKYIIFQKICKPFAEYVSQPFVQIIDTTVAGSRSVTFTCISPDTDISIRWIFNNQNLKLTERMTLSPTKCGLKIDPFKSEDAGEYKCEVSNRFSLETSLPVSWPR
ncbi:pregnancy-specific glycoprotein 22-like [Peromyscus californicus insignis]|uniref:pregnancy-specific glycoprotein 22-like n=1 Tax=Peromyscus californicus insignis TaxID=564181 RepID=UPI0022A6685C|nr:pregnancy-specific glycoprotein 22-like [Peromyscus californicus insignis]